MKPRVILAVRTKINWLKMNEEKFFAQGKGPITQNIFKPDGHWLTKHWDYIQLWNSILAEEYFTTRHKLQKFADKTHEKVKNVDFILTGKQSIYHFINRYKNDKWVILPTDDDDCFSPDVVEHVLEAEEEGHDVVSWKTGCFGTTTPVKGLRVVPMESGIFPSNSYAITDRVAKKVPSRLINEMVSRHCIVRQYSNKFLLPYKIIPNVLSMYNMNPLSFSSTRRKDMNVKSITRYFTAIGNALREQNVKCPATMNWIAPYVVGITKILKECFSTV